MRVTVNKNNNKESQLELNVQDTDKNNMVFYLPVRHVEYWYPFNINFTYKYATSKSILYLVKESAYTGDNLYNVDILKKSKPLDKVDGTFFQPDVYERNQYIIEKARGLDIPEVTEVHNLYLEDVQEGFRSIDLYLNLLKDTVEDRIPLEDRKYNPNTVTNEDRDAQIYENMEKYELRFVQELGEIYSMLTIMRKIVE